MLPTADVRLISQQLMSYCCVSHGQLFLPEFLPLTEPFSCVPGASNYNKEYMIIMSSLAQDDDRQSSDFLLSVWECDKVYGRG